MQCGTAQSSSKIRATSVAVVNLAGSPESVSNFCPSSRQLVRCRFLFLVVAQVCPPREISAILLVETVATDDDVSDVDDVSHTRSTSPRKCRLHLSRVLSSEYAPTCSTYVALQVGWISSTHVLASALLFLEKPEQSFV